MNWDVDMYGSTTVTLNQHPHLGEIVFAVATLAIVMAALVVRYYNR